MARKFDQHKIQETVEALRLVAGDNPSASYQRLLNTAAELIEDMSVVVYGIKERLPGIASCGHKEWGESGFCYEMSCENYIYKKARGMAKPTIEDFKTGDKL